MWVKIDGIWRYARSWRNVSGAWKQGRFWDRISGTWKMEWNALGFLNYGNLVYINYNGVNEPFIVVGKNVHGTGNVTIMNRDVLTGNNGSQFDSTGRAYYNGSTIDVRLTGVGWGEISTAHQALCKTVAIEVWNGSTISTINRAIFALSQKEIGCTDYYRDEGERCLYFNAVASGTTYTTRDLFYDTDGTTKRYWWTRTVVNTTYAKRVNNASGTVVSYSQTNYGYNRWRFALVISEGQRISESPDGSGVYSFIT